MQRKGDRPPLSSLAVQGRVVCQQLVPWSLQRLHAVHTSPELTGVEARREQHCRRIHYLASGPLLLFHPPQGGPEKEEMIQRDVPRIRVPVIKFSTGGSFCDFFGGARGSIRPRDPFLVWQVARCESPFVPTTPLVYAVLKWRGYPIPVRKHANEF